MARQLILVDGSNVAWEAQTADRKPRVSNIIGVRRELEAIGFKPLVIVDASLKHHIDDPDQLEALFSSGQILQAPSGTVADYFLLRTAQEHGAQVVSNDEFEQYKSDFTWIKRRRVPFMIVNGSVQIYLPKLSPPAPSRPEQDPAAALRPHPQSGAAEAGAEAAAG